MHFFNTAGPCEPDRHYMIPAAQRLSDAPELIERGSYFVLHAPRQTGKTTTLRALASEVTAQGRYAALYFSCKVAEAAGDDVVRTQHAILDDIRRRAIIESGELLEGDMPYHEVAPQLVMMAFFQGVVNGKGAVAREYGLGRDRIDLLLRWPYEGQDGKPAWQQEAIELKVWRDRRADPLTAGLVQLDRYLDSLGLGHGYLVVFDRRSGAVPRVERLGIEPAQTQSQRPVTVLRA